MKVAIFSTADYEQPFFAKANQTALLEITYFKETLNLNTVTLAKGFPAICCFISDQLDAEVITILSRNGTKLIALRSAGYDHVDLAAAKNHGLTVVNAATYSPAAIAEQATLLTLSLLRKFKPCLKQVEINNFKLDHLLGKNISGSTVGIIGTGSIGTAFAKIMQGFGANLLGYDPYPNENCKEFGIRYVTPEQLLVESDIISLHCLLNESTRHFINDSRLKLLKPSAILINTARGGVVDTQAVLTALNAGKLSGFGMDVYEHEKGLFFKDCSDSGVDDALFNALKAHPNVIITPHAAYFTESALNRIANTTIENIVNFSKGHITNQVAK